MKVIEVITDTGHVDTILGIAEQCEVEDCWQYALEDEERHMVKMLVSNDSVQSVLDSTQKVLSSSDISKIVVMPVEAAIPRIKNNDKKKKNSSTSREELYQQIEQNTQIDVNYFLLVLLSSIVAAVGMLENNIAVVIGAMVIAPLLGPNIALAFGTVLGDTQLMLRALIALVLGILLALAASYLLAYAYPNSEYSHELLTRTTVGLSAIVMALASGAAAALSMTTRLSAVLVGVMVAVAILPPTVAMGLMIGYQNYGLALGAFILLSVNIVCINISGNIIFLAKGIRPRTQSDNKKAKRTAYLYIFIWLILLLSLLIILIKD